MERSTTKDTKDRLNRRKAEIEELYQYSRVGQGRFTEDLDKELEEINATLAMISD